MKKMLQIGFAVALLTGCAPSIVYKKETVSSDKIRMGQFTILSSNNVRGLNYSKKNNTAVFVQGEFCVSSDTLLTDGALQEAVDDAIRKGQIAGIDGDVIVNARISQIKKATYENAYTGSTKTGSIFLNDQTCYIVEGELVRIDGK